MRPPMIIVLFSAGQDVSALLVLRLRVRFPATVLRAYSVEDAEWDLAAHSTHRSGTLLICLATPNDAELLVDIEALTGRVSCPVLVIDTHALLAPERLRCGIRHLTARATAPSAVFEHLAQMRLRKTGPKKPASTERVMALASTA